MVCILSIEANQSFSLQTVIHLAVNYFNHLIYCFIISVMHFFRNAGDEWLVTFEDTEMYIPEVSEVSFM